VGCGGGLPPGEGVPVCCMFGYVFIDGQAVQGAKVTISSAHGSVELWTDFGPNSTQPYYRTSLSDPPLSMQAGDSISITAEYSSHSQTVIHQVLGGGQQVDVVLPRNQPDDYMYEGQIWQQAEPGKFNTPWDVAVDGSGTVYVIDDANARVQVFNSSGLLLRQWGTLGNEPGQFSSNTRGIVVDHLGNVYVAESHNNRIQKFTSTGTWLASWGKSGSGDGQFNVPGGMSVDSTGNVFVADGMNNRIQKFTSTGTWLASWGRDGSGNGQLACPVGVAVDGEGKI
jgi:DNA-binding beta-propeller fold protein YncE